MRAFPRQFSSRPLTSLGRRPEARKPLSHQQKAPSGDGGQEWIRTTEGVSQRIYSPPRLATSVPTRFREGVRFIRGLLFARKRLFSENF